MNSQKIIFERYLNEKHEPSTFTIPTALLGHSCVASAVQFHLVAFYYSHPGIKLPVAAIARELYMDARTVTTATASLLESHLIEKSEGGGYVPCKDDLENYIDCVLAKVE